jgi:hypothetical protein
LRSSVLISVLAACHFTPGNKPSNDAAADVAPGDVTLVASDVMVDAKPAMPIPIIAVQSNSASMGNTTSNAVAFTDAQRLGDLNVVVVSWASNAPLATLTDVAGNTYVSLGLLENSNVSQHVYYAENIHAALAGTNIVTVTFASTSFGSTLRISEYSGIATSISLDTKVSSAGTSSTAAATITTTHAHDLIYAAETSNHNATATGVMFTQRLIEAGDVSQDREVAMLGTYQPTAAIDQSATWLMLVAAFKGAQ